MPGLDTTVNQRSLPLAYSFVGHEPESTVACDAAKCDIVDNDSPVNILTCGHTFHLACKEKSGLCSICQPLLTLKLKALADAFNRGLLKDGNSTEDVDDGTEDGVAESSDDDSGGDDDEETSDNEKMKKLKERYSSSDYRQSLVDRLREVHASPEAPAVRPFFPNRSSAPHLAGSSTATPSATTNGQCPDCGKAYKTIRGLTQHQRLAHKI